MSDDIRSLAKRVIENSASDPDSQRLATLALVMDNEVREAVRAFEKFGLTYLLVDAHGRVSLSLGVLRALAKAAEAPV